MATIENISDSEPERIGDMIIVQLVKAICELNKSICELKDQLASLEEGKKKSNQKKNVSIDNNKDNQKRNIYPRIYTKNKVSGVSVDPDFAETLSPELLNFYESFAIYYPSIAMMDDPLTYEQYARLCSCYSRAHVNHKIEELENYKAIKKYKSAYRTLLKWLRR